MNGTSTEIRKNVAGCVEFASLFQHELMEEPPTTSAPAEDRRNYSLMERQAENLCAACPLMTQCLYHAVVKHDVSGYAAGTTKKQRTEIRHRLGIIVKPEDFDTLAGVTGHHRQVDHDEVIRLRNANPHESLETLATRMGCSLSTVKRHLRKARNSTEVTPIRTAKLPSPQQVWSTLAAITRGNSLSRRAA